MDRIMGRVPPRWRWLTVVVVLAVAGCSTAATAAGTPAVSGSPQAAVATVVSSSAHFPTASQAAAAAVSEPQVSNMPSVPFTTAEFSSVKLAFRAANCDGSLYSSYPQESSSGLMQYICGFGSDSQGVVHIYLFASAATAAEWEANVKTTDTAATIKEIAGNLRVACSVTTAANVDQAAKSLKI